MGHPVLHHPLLVIAVWHLNRRQRSEPSAGDLLLSPSTALLFGTLGIAATATSLFLFLLPSAAIAIWPWTLTELTARVTGAIFALGVAGLGAFTDKRWTSMRILLQVAALMLGLFLISAVRSGGDFDTSKPLTWIFAAGHGTGGRRRNPLPPDGSRGPHQNASPSRFVQR